MLAIETLNAKLIKRDSPVRLNVCDISVPPVAGGLSEVAALNGVDECRSDDIRTGVVTFSHQNDEQT